MSRLVRVHVWKAGGGVGRDSSSRLEMDGRKRKRETKYRKKKKKILTTNLKRRVFDQVACSILTMALVLPFNRCNIFVTSKPDVSGTAHVFF